VAGKGLGAGATGAGCGSRCRGRDVHSYATLCNFNDISRPLAQTLSFVTFT